MQFTKTTTCRRLFVDTFKRLIFLRWGTILFDCGKDDLMQMQRHQFLFYMRFLGIVLRLIADRLRKY